MTVCDLCRFSRLANGSGKVSIADLEQNADLSGNVFIPCIFSMYADSKGFLSQKDFTSAIERLGQLYTGQDRAECKPLSHSIVNDDCQPLQSACTVAFQAGASLINTRVIDYCRSLCRSL